MEHRDRATGWQHAKLSGHENEDLVKIRLDTDEEFAGSLLRRINRPFARILHATIGGLHEINVPSVNGRKTKSKTDLKVYLDTNEVINVSIKKSLGGQVYFVRAGLFIDTFEKQFNTQIPDDVCRAINLFWAAADDAIDIIKEYGDQTITKNYDLQLRHKSLNATTLKDFFENRPYYIQRYCDTVLKASNRIHEEGYELEIDIPFWFDSDRDTVINEKGESENVISVLSRYVDTLCIMSYRDSAEDILQISSEEIAFARLSGCRVVCGVETYSLEGDHVSFKEEEKEKMNKELEKLLELLEDEEISGYGVAIHYLDTWYNLKDM
ncbi:MAG TPA: hypothetical protein DEV98_04030 [Clostridiales bacterium]|nr:hypothetical protein [Clostridiales bacterium]